MKRAFLVAMILVLMFLPAVPEKVLGASVLWQAWIHETDDPTIVVAWDPVEGATSYEVKTIARHPLQEWMMSTARTQAVLPRPRAGLFRFAVRACNADGCSDWAYSDGPTAAVAMTDGQILTRPWGVFWRLSPVIIR